MKKIMKMLVAGATMLGIISVASATPTIYVSTTGAAGSYSAVASSPSGVVTYVGSAGVWNLVISSGFTMPAAGSATAPAMDLDVQGTSTGAGQLWIAFAANGFSDPLGGIQSTISGHVVSGAAETYNFSVFDDVSNLMPTTTVPTGTVITTLSGSLPANTSAFGILPSGYPETLGELVHLSTTGITSTSVDASFSAVPDGGSCAILLGSALTGLALLRRKMAA